MSATRDTPPEAPAYGRFDQSAENDGLDRGLILGRGLRSLSMTCLRLAIVAIFLAMVGWLLGKVWVGVFPVLLALLVSSVLAAPAGLLHRAGLPRAIAALVTVLLFLGTIGGVLFALAPSMIEQGREIAAKSGQGVQQVQDLLHGPPFNIKDSQIDRALDTATTKLQQQGDRIAGGVFTTVSTVGNALVTGILVLVLSFFFLKDGHAFLPWLSRLAGRTAGHHLTEVLARVWRTLGSYIRAQAIVAGIDAAIIGVGLLLIQVPLWGPLAILTFLSGFIPIVGAVAAGGLAVLVALVTVGLKGALLTLALILFVQNVEGNITAPLIQGKSMQLHAAVVLLSVTVGGTLAGITGAFLAVPLAAVLAVVLRYVDEQIDLRTGDLDAAHVATMTDSGRVVVEEGEARGQELAQAAARGDLISPEAPAADAVDAMAGRPSPAGQPTAHTGLRGLVSRLAPRPPRD